MTPVAEVLVTIGGSPAASLLVKATAIVVLALAGVTLARAARAAVRHALLASALAALLVLPAASVFMTPANLHVPVKAALLAAPPVALMPTTDRTMPERASVLRGDPPSSTNQRSASAVEPLLTVWVAGALLFLVPVAVGVYRTWGIRGRGRPWQGGEAVVAQLVADAGRRRIDVLLHESIPAPMTCGVVRPAILLPPDAPTWPEDELRRAMVHELQHIRRGDWMTQCAAHVVCALYWFHPLVWMAKGRLVLEAERACDDVVLRESEASSYADQLVTLAQRLSTATSRPMVGMATTTHFATRVRAVLDPGQRRGCAGAGWVTVAAVSATLLAAALAPIRAVAAAPRVERVASQSSHVESTPVGLDAAESRAVAQPLPRPAPAVPRPTSERSKPAAIPTATPQTGRELFVPAQDGTASAQNVEPRMLVLLFDVTSFSAELLQQMVAASRNLPDSMGGSDMTAVVSMTPELRVLTDFTGDREALRAAIQSLSASPEKPAVVQVPQTAADGLAASISSTAATSPGALTDARLRGLATICETLSPIQRRKAVLYFSTGMTTRADGFNQTDLRAATNACNRANVAIYPVDARGLVRLVVP